MPRHSKCTQLDVFHLCSGVGVIWRHRNVEGMIVIAHCDDYSDSNEVGELKVQKYGLIRVQLDSSFTIIQP